MIFLTFLGVSSNPVSSEDQNTCNRLLSIPATVHCSSSLITAALLMTTPTDCYSSMAVRSDQEAWEDGGGSSWGWRHDGGASERLYPSLPRVSTLLSSYSDEESDVAVAGED